MQETLNLGSPDLTQEQRKLLQDWLKRIKRQQPQSLPRQIGFTLWAIRKSRKELTPANFAYYEPIARKTLLGILHKYERHIAAERNIKNGNVGNRANHSRLPGSTRSLDDNG